MDLINILFAKALNKEDATKEYVNEAIKALKGEVSADLDTLEELSRALGNDPDFFLTVKNEFDSFKTELVTGNDAATENTRFAIGIAEQNLEVPSMEEFNQLKDEKLSEPTEGLAVGKYFRIAALDENGHAVLEAVDAPKEGLATTPTGWPEWTADEQATARQRMNAQGSYKHIATITIDEDGVCNVGIDRDENGMVFSVSDVYIYGYIKKTSGTTSITVAVNTITTTINGINNIIKLPVNYAKYGAQFELNIKKSKYWRAYAVSSIDVSDPNINSVTGNTSVSHRGASNVRKNEWETLTALAFATDDTAFGIGTTFDIWGR